MFLELTFFHPQNVWKLSLNHFAKHIKFELLTNVSYSLLLSRWLIPNANFSIFPSKFFGICQYTLYLSEIIFSFPFLEYLFLKKEKKIYPIFLNKLIILNKFVRRPRKTNPQSKTTKTFSAINILGKKKKEKITNLEHFQNHCCRPWINFLSRTRIQGIFES